MVKLLIISIIETLGVENVWDNILGKKVSQTFGQECASAAIWMFFILLLRSVIFLVGLAPHVPNGLIFSFPYFIQVQMHKFLLPICSFSFFVLLSGVTLISPHVADGVHFNTICTRQHSTPPCASGRVFAGSSLVQSVPGSLPSPLLGEHRGYCVLSMPLSGLHERGSQWVSEWVSEWEIGCFCVH